jgi:hypothetical protein
MHNRSAMKKCTRSATILVTLIALFAQQAMGQPGENWLTGWDYRTRIETDDTKVDSELSDFVVAVVLTGANFDFTRAQSGGQDIRFTAADGSTLLTFEREMHDATGQKAVYWVRIPTLKSTEETYLYLYYGNSGASDAANTSGGAWTRQLWSDPAHGK